jgi:hypothetical protein
VKAVATSPLLERCADLVERAAAWRTRGAAEFTRRARARTNRSDVEFARAWDELRGHPALSWVPPMWRTDTGSDLDTPHVVRAVDKNLFVDITSDGDHRVMVQLRTGPLRDRIVGDGLDPVTPVASVDPELTVVAPSFEEAVLELRDVVVAVYGTTHHEATHPAHAKTRWYGGELFSARRHLTDQRP